MVTPTLILKVEENEQTSSAILSHAHAPSENAAATAAATSATTTTVAEATAATKASETAVMDKYLATGDEFFQRLILVKIKVKDENTEQLIQKVWPGLRFVSISKLQEKVTEDIAPNVSNEFLSKIRRKLLKYSSGDRGIAYLIGREKISESIVSLNDEGLVLDYSPTQSILNLMMNNSKRRARLLGNELMILNLMMMILLHWQLPLFLRVR